VTNPPEAPDIDQVLKHTKSVLARHVSGRIALGVALLAVPFVTHALGGPSSFFTAIPIVPGLFVLLFLFIRTGNGRRLAVCERVLRTYPLDYRTRVDKKREQWSLIGNVFTIKLSTRGQHGAPQMRALNASTVRRWPKGAEGGGAWVAGDLAFGGVMIVPRTNDMLFMQPSDWQKFALEREQADATRIAQAEQAGITKLIEKEPRTMYGL
jgi:hypothetical protein